MALVKPPEHPFTLMREFTTELDRLFGSTDRGDYGAWYPALEFIRRNGNVRITAHLPDVEKEDIRVFVDHHSLILEGERKPDRHRKRTSGKFHREIPIPAGLDPDEVTARLVDGNLIVEFPFEERQRRAIPIQSEEDPS